MCCCNINKVNLVHLHEILCLGGKKEDSSTILCLLQFSWSCFCPQRGSFCTQVLELVVSCLLGNETCYIKTMVSVSVGSLPKAGWDTKNLVFHLLLLKTGDTSASDINNLNSQGMKDHLEMDRITPMWLYFFPNNIYLKTGSIINTHPVHWNLTVGYQHEAFAIFPSGWGQAYHSFLTPAPNIPTRLWASRTQCNYCVL